ncbi:MAG: amino acid ABC transporter ATP-binding protein [Clostridia bacterium]|nr:amino acid ABC transporter ATP-binding protein [Clostridia bacterium]
MAFLEVREIYKSFGKSNILNGVGFDLENGEVLSIIGSSGNGKTTLLRCINFLETVDSGTVTLNGELLLDGESSKKEKESEIREKRLHFGLVFQQFNLFPQYTAFNNIKLPLELMEKERAKKGLKSLTDGDIDKEVHSLLKKVGLEAKKDLYPCQLSGGQQQRVAIARAMALKPDVLCFDEPTSALDPELTGEVLKVIRELKEKEKITMIIVTHEMEFAKNISDKILFLSRGTAGEIGTPKQLFEESDNPEIRKFLKTYSEEQTI